MTRATEVGFFPAMSGRGWLTIWQRTRGTRTSCLGCADNERMCGRFTLDAPPDIVQQLFDFAAPPPSWEPERTDRPRYNIAPTQPILVIRGGPEGRAGAWARWGVTAAKQRLAINARSETVFERSAFRTAVRSRRVLVPASGFLEWKVVGRRRRPRHIVPVDGGLLAFAGVVTESRTGDLGCAILTTRANSDVVPIHDRMPVILCPEQQAAWLDPDLESPYALEPLFAPLAEGRLRLVPVSERVNKVQHDDPDCLAPAEPEAEAAAEVAESARHQRRPSRRTPRGADPRQLGFDFGVTLAPARRIGERSEGE